MTPTKTKKVEEAQPGGKTQTEPPWNVILHNEWENSVTRVVWVLVRVIPGMSLKKATKVMWEAHTKGKAVAKTCHKEQKRIGWEMAVRIEKILCTVMHEAHRRQVEEAMILSPRGLRDSTGVIWTEERWRRGLYCLYLLPWAGAPQPS